MTNSHQILIAFITFLSSSLLAILYVLAYHQKWFLNLISKVWPASLKSRVINLFINNESIYFENTSKPPYVLFEDRKRTVVFWVFFGFLTLLALTLRYLSLPAINEDLKYQVFKWFDYIAANGGFSALEDTSISNYNPPYLFLLACATYFPWISKLVLIKIISIIFDFLCAIAIYKIVRHFASFLIAWLAYFFVLLSPIVWLNSAYWGQCDAIYTSFILFSIYSFIKKKPIFGYVLFAISFSFKLQAVFFLPFLLVILFGVDHRWYLFFVIPITFLIMSLPAVIAGQSIVNILTIYLDQTGQYAFLTLNAPSIFGLFNYLESQPSYEIIGFSLLLIIMCGISLVSFWNRGRIGDKQLILFALISLLVTPFLLPRMHERYFYPAAVSYIILLFSLPNLWVAALLINFTTFFSYFPFLWDLEVLPLPVLSIMNFISIVILLVSISRLNKNVVGVKKAEFP